MKLGEDKYLCAVENLWRNAVLVLKIALFLMNIIGSHAKIHGGNSFGGCRTLCWAHSDVALWKESRKTSERRDLLSLLINDVFDVAVTMPTTVAGGSGVGARAGAHTSDVSGDVSDLCAAACCAVSSVCSISARAQSCERNMCRNYRSLARGLCSPFLSGKTIAPDLDQSVP